MEHPVRRHGILRSHGLSLVFLALTLLALAGHALAGWRHETAERLAEGLPAPTLGAYLGSGAFLSSLLENWESEFLQMGLFVLLTVRLRQWGSSESRPLDPSDESPPPPVPREQQPWPVRRGGWVRTVYEHSLSTALLALFAASLVGHWMASWSRHAQEQARQGLSADSMLAYAGNPTFWFECFQNWQSEFLSVVALCLLSIWLREKDSPQSKAVTARHTDTGT